MALISLSALACGAYLVPLLLVTALWLRPGDDAVAVACRLAIVFAADLLGTLGLTHVLSLEQATFVRTLLLLVAAGAVFAWRKRKGSPWFRAANVLSRADLVAVLGAAALALAFSHYISSRYWIWDREWHTPFTASLRAQSMPIVNVYEPGRPLRYHLIGDVAGASLQSLSFGAMSAARSLGYAHDLQTLLLAVIIALVLRSQTSWNAITVAVAALVPLLAGPLAFASHPDGGRGAFEGFAEFNNLTLSFRPHCMVALVTMAGIVAVLLRLALVAEDALSTTTTRGAWLVVLFALLGISDEISTLVFGLALGVVWLVRPQLFGPRRWHGLAVLSSAGAAALLANLTLAGTIGPGGVVRGTNWVAPRLPRFFAAPLRLGTHHFEVYRELAVDVGSVVVPLLVVAFVLLVARSRLGALVVPLGFALVVGAVCILLFLCFEVNGRTWEGHRFMTATRLVTPFVALLFLPRLKRAWAPTLLLLAPIAAGAVATLGYVFSSLPTAGAAYPSGANQYDVDCRSDYGARLGEAAEATWIDESMWFEYAGCHPVFAPPGGTPDEDVRVGWPAQGLPALNELEHGFLRKHDALRMICPRDRAKASPLCERARKLVHCEPEGSHAVACSIRAGKRKKLKR